MAIYDVLFKGSRECKGCFENKEITSFPIHRNSVGGRRQHCKKCFSLFESNKAIRKRAEKNPHKYMMCNNCDRYFAKDRYIFGKRSERTLCRYCGSEDIERY